MPSPCETRGESFFLRIGNETEIKVEVTQHEDSEDRFVCELAPSITGGDSNLMEPGVGLRVLSPGTAEEDEDVCDCLNVPFDVILTHNDSILGSSFTLQKFWTLCYILFTKWSDQPSYYFKLPRKFLFHDWYMKAQISGLLSFEAISAQNSALSSDDQLFCAVVRRSDFWKGAGASSNNRWAPLLHDNTFSTICMYREGLFGSQASNDTKNKNKNKIALAMAPFASGTLYERFIPEMRQTLTFRMLNLNSSIDTELLQKWNISDFIKRDWCETEEFSTFTSYLECQVYPAGYALVGELDGVPISYAEVMWDERLLTMDDTLNRCIPVSFRIVLNPNVLRNHALVIGSMKGLIHMLFLLGPGTLEVRAAPSAKCMSVVKHLCDAGGYFSEVSLRFKC